MFGAVRYGTAGDRNTAPPEWNAAQDVPASRRVMAAPWKEATIAPLDTCGIVRLEGDRFKRILACKDRIAETVVENYRTWDGFGRESDTRSTVLFDTVAVYLALHRDLCKMERLKLAITDDGVTHIAPDGTAMNVATQWKNLDAYLDWLVKRLVE